MTIVVDCSVALKWVLNEDDRGSAMALIGQSLIAPDFLKLECANVLAMRVRKGFLTPAGSRSSLKAIQDISGVSYRPSEALMEHAQDLALELDQTAYDSLYLALAIRDTALLVTADQKFAEAVEGSRAYKPYLQRLSSIKS